MPQLPTSLKGAELKKKLVELASTTRPDKPLDIYVTSSTGHQIREDGGGGVTGWQGDRNRKLKSQFSRSGSVLGVKRKASDITPDLHIQQPKSKEVEQTSSTTSTTQSVTASSSSKPPKQIFKGCTIYINGNTTLSGISDIELKRLLSSHGATVSYHLARRQVTHVILTDPSTTSSSLSSSQSHPSASTSTSASSSLLSTSSSSQIKLSKTTTTSGTAILSSRKLELEMKGRVKSKIHYVSVEWVLTSIKEERRLAETKFPVVPLREARQGTLMDCKRVKASQRSLTDMMVKKS
ncbi:hypothetical protein ABW19_dt0206729 [Dactylella cylindrospora]|nr:hypothetical protein ABW19_dt0206729 [Dactylella cylindrospora]